MVDITRKPTFAVEKMKNGRTKVTYSVNVDGKETIAQFVHENENDAKMGARNRLVRSIKSQHESMAKMTDTEVERSIGANSAKLEPSSQISSRINPAPPPLGERSPEPSAKANISENLQGVTPAQAKKAKKAKKANFTEKPSSCASLRARLLFLLHQKMSGFGFCKFCSEF